jgi:hypothetical protein
MKVYIVDVVMGTLLFVLIGMFGFLFWDAAQSQKVLLACQQKGGTTLYRSANGFECYKVTKELVK